MPTVLLHGTYTIDTDVWYVMLNFSVNQMRNTAYFVWLMT